MKVGIIGAGITGLTVAYELTRRGHAVTLFEATAVAGGLASGFKAGNWDWPLDRFYHHLFASDYEAMALAKEIGLGPSLFFRKPVTAVWYKGRAYPLDTPLAVLRFPHLSFLEKMRMGLVVLYLKLQNNWRPLERATAHQWLPKYMGERAYRIVWEPLFVGKFSREYTEVNMAWFWARIHKRSKSLGYFAGGFQALADTLVEHIHRHGGKVLFQTPVQKIVPRAAGQSLTLHTAKGEDDFERVVVTLSPDLLAQITPALPEGYLTQLRNLRWLGALALIVALDRPLTHGHYWINLPKEEGFPFLALVEHTNYIDPAHYGGDHLVYLGDYPPPGHEYFQLSKEELLERFLPHLLRFNPGFDPAWVRQSWLFREDYAQPVPLLNHSQKIPDLQTPIPGLFWASMSQVYPWDRGTNYSVELGRKVASMVDAD
ncbi:MAG: NAD(P)/FAD-dependent oxidoreductase [Anaerolineae bacterium]